MTYCMVCGMVMVHPYDPAHHECRRIVWEWEAEITEEPTPPQHSD